MAIPAKQIGSSYEANLLWQIAKQLEQLSKVTGNINDEINFKIALYSNVIKLNFLNDNILEVEKGIVKILGLYNMNFNLNQNMNNYLQNHSPFPQVNME